MIEEGITALEALGIAIRSEIDAGEIYGDLAAMCADEAHRDRFLSLRQEERRHQILLEKQYKEMFPDVELKLPESQLPHRVRDSSLRKRQTIKEIVGIAIDEERRSREFYLDCAERATDISGKRMFRFLADMEFSHQGLLAAELELLEKYPTYLEGNQPWEVEPRLRAEGMTRHTDSRIGE
jgi:rubrerythrin